MCVCVCVCVCVLACSMEEGAADKCKEFIERALQYHYDNPEALQLMASYLFSTERNEVSVHTHTHTHYTHTVRMNYHHIKAGIC